MNYIVLSFDYELFFGENYGGYSAVLFDPTYMLVDSLHRNGISGTFFIDTCSLKQAIKHNQSDYVEGFESQIRYLAENGQDIQLHIHPHWLMSEFDGNKWIFDNNSYRIHSFGSSDSDNGADEIVKYGIDTLNRLIRPFYREYECIAYRAGGFCIQPHKELIRTLYNNGIRVDSSVAPMLFSNSDTQFYDYRHKTEGLNWFISDNAEWWENCDDGLFLYEIPIATVNKNPVKYVFNRLLCPNNIRLDLGKKRGTYISENSKTDKSLLSYYRYIRGFNAISLDSFAAEYLYYQVKRLFRNNSGDDQVVALIGHPKLVTDSYVENLCRFINLIRKDDNLGIISIYDAYKRERNKWR